MAQALGLGVLPWSPLGGGVLTGKYTRTDIASSLQSDVAATRKGVIASAGHLSEQAIGLGEMVRKIADEIGASPAQVALAWLLGRPGVAAPVLGARTTAQLEDNLGALEVALSTDQVARLDQSSAPAPIFPDRFLRRPMLQQLIFGATVRPGR
jgi:aryl-alcohol dehydrogenase-like predicted oxidoreductase